MHPIAQELRSAIRHALALGLDTPGALEPLIQLAEPARALGWEALAERIEAVRDTNLAHEDEQAFVMNELVRLWEVSRQIGLRTMPLHRLPETSVSHRPSPGAWLNLDPVPEELWLAFLEGHAPLIVTVPLVRHQIERWEPDEPLDPILIGLSHSITTQAAGERLQALGISALPFLTRMLGARNMMIRIRAWEILLRLHEEGIVPSRRIESHLKKCPPSMPLLRWLKVLGMSPSLPTPEVPLETFISARCAEGWSRSSFRELLRLYRFDLMQLPEDSPLIEEVVTQIHHTGHALERRMELLARLPHPRVTQLLRSIPDLDPHLWALHIEATMDYRLIPRLLKYAAPGDDAIRRAAELGDSLLLPFLRAVDERALQPFGEVARYLAARWRHGSDPIKQKIARQILKGGSGNEGA